MARRLTRALVCLSMLDVSLGDSQLLVVNTIQYSLFLTHGQKADQGLGVLINAGSFAGGNSQLLVVNTIQVISKEMVRNFWNSLITILGHKFYQNHPDRVIRCE